jgi:hypothetical protein
METNPNHFLSGIHPKVERRKNVKGVLWWKGYVVKGWHECSEKIWRQEIGEIEQKKDSIKWEEIRRQSVCGTWLIWMTRKRKTMMQSVTC